jgi:hypothetical protein
VVIKTAFIKQYEDRTKSIKAFNKLYSLHQEKMIIKELNRKFNSLMINLKPKPNDRELRRVYANMLKLGVTAKQLRRITVDISIFKVLTKIENWENWSKEQEAVYYRVLEATLVPTTTTSSEVTPMKIEKGVKIYHYCKKPHVIIDCKKRMVKVNKLIEKKKREIKCYCCDQIEHIVK